MICPFKMASNLPYLGCHRDCALYMNGKCAIAVMAENCLDDCDLRKDDGNG